MLPNRYQHRSIYATFLHSVQRENFSCPLSSRYASVIRQNETENTMSDPATLASRNRMKMRTVLVPQNSLSVTFWTRCPSGLRGSTQEDSLRARMAQAARVRTPFVSCFFFSLPNLHSNSHNGTYLCPLSSRACRGSRACAHSAHSHARTAHSRRPVSPRRLHAKARARQT